MFIFTVTGAIIGGLLTRNPIGLLGGFGLGYYAEKYCPDRLRNYLLDKTTTIKKEVYEKYYNEELKKFEQEAENIVFHKKAPTEYEKL